MQGEKFLKMGLGTEKRPFTLWNKRLVAKPNICENLRAMSTEAAGWENVR